MYVSLIKSLAEKIGFKEIRELKGFVNLYFENREDFSLEELKEISTSFKGEMQMDLSDRPSFKIPISKTKLIDTYNLLEVIDNTRSNDEKNK